MGLCELFKVLAPDREGTELLLVKPFLQGTSLLLISQSIRGPEHSTRCTKIPLLFGKLGHRH